MKNARKNRQDPKKVASFVIHIKWWHGNQSFPECIFIKLLYSSFYVSKAIPSTCVILFESVISTEGN